MRTAIKPKTTKRVDFEIPRGIINQGYSRWNYLTRSYDPPTYANDAEALAAGSVDWVDGEEIGATVTYLKDRLVVLIGNIEDELSVVPQAAFFKLTPTIAKKLIKRALAAKDDKLVALTDAEKEEAKMKRKRGPRFERVPGKGNLYVFTAPCGEKSVLKEETLKSLVAAIEFAEKELK